MLSRRFRIGLAIVFIGAGCAAWTFLLRENVRYRERVASLRREHAESAHLQKQIARTRELLSHTSGGKDVAAEALRADIARLRREVAEAEKRAADKRARFLADRATDETSLAQNRDPEKGLVRLENLTQAGQASPAAALQTLLWAALHGHEDVIAQTVSVAGDARATAEEIIAGLSESERAKWPTPEKLAALFFAGAVLEELHSIQIVDEQFASDFRQATLRFRGNGQTKEAQLSFAHGPNGWAMVVPAPQIDRIRAQLARGLPAKRTP